MSIIDTQPAPGWAVYGAMACWASYCREPGSIRLHRSYAAACRRTWERWALGVLGPAMWSYDDDGHSVVTFLYYGIHQFHAPENAPPSLADRSTDDSLAALVAAAQDAVRKGRGQAAKPIHDS